MSFEPATRWMLRCDGRISHDRQCGRHYVFVTEPEDDISPMVWVPALFEEQALTVHDLRALRGAGWLALRDGRVLCDRHVAGLTRLAQSQIEGLPFDDPAQTDRGDQ